MAGKEKSRKEDVVTEAKNFFDFYKKELGEFLKGGGNVVYVDFMKLTEFSSKLSDEVMSNPEDTLRAVEVGIGESGLASDVRVRLFNLPEVSNIKVRDLRAKHLDEFVVIEGIVRQASEVRPQVVNAEFECPSCGTVMRVLQLDKKFREPSRCSCGRKGGFRLLRKDLVDTQRLIIEEAPESLSGGEQPKRLNVFLKEDLVEPKMEEKTTPGSRVKVIGILKEVPVPLSTGGISTRFELALEANNIIPLEETFEELNISEEDEKQILELSEDPELFDKFSRSIVPSVWGYEEMKKSLVLQLFGGVRKIHSDGKKSRGDIHILLIGDPGVAKSVSLTFMSEISPKGRYVVGKSASGAGLTATVVRDEYLRGWSLEAGAMVLANRGLVCVDELEKMDEQERSSMHEAMEQQTITISKANVQATLRSETSVLAAANPKFGRFDPHEPVPKQINLPPTLINRFDIMFTLRDIPKKERDQQIASHVLRGGSESGEETIERDLLRKYVAYAKQRFKPKLIEDSIKEIENFYVDLRNRPIFSERGIRPIPISARQLEALIRMSEAHAKLRLSDEVTREDSEKAIEIMKYYLEQVGYDPETNTFDIDRTGASGVSNSQRNKIYMVRDTINKLAEKFGQEIPLEEIEKELEGKMDNQEIEDSMQKLKKEGEIYEPTKGHVGKV